MAEHYYSKVPTSAHAEETFSETVRGETLTFSTDAGVFSKGGMDFGTRLLIESAGSLHGRVLDLGCGWGAVGVVLGRTNPALNLVMADVNERALSLAKKNLIANGVFTADVVESDGYANVEGMFDAILTNPPIRAGKQVVYGFFDGALSRLNPGGRLLVVIRKQQGAPSALKHIESVFGNAEVIQRDKGYWIISATKE